MITIETDEPHSAPSVSVRESWPGCHRSPSAGWCGCKSGRGRKPRTTRVEQRCGNWVMCLTNSAWRAWRSAPAPRSVGSWGPTIANVILPPIRCRACPTNWRAARLYRAARRRLVTMRAGNRVLAGAVAPPPEAITWCVRRDRRWRAPAAPCRYRDRRDLGNAGSPESIRCRVSI